MRGGDEMKGEGRGSKEREWDERRGDVMRG